MFNAIKCVPLLYITSLTLLHTFEIEKAPVCSGAFNHKSVCHLFCYLFVLSTAVSEVKNELFGLKSFTTYSFSYPVCLGSLI